MCGVREPGTIYTERGSQIHETYEEFHVALLDYIEEHGERPTDFTSLLPERELWQQWVEYIGTFFKFEERRWQETHRSMIGEIYTSDWRDRLLDRWKPVGVEVEFWVGGIPDSWDREPSHQQYVNDDPDSIPLGDAPWMGYADLIVPTSSISGIDGSGVVIIDYKTGTAPTVKYEGKPWLEENLNEGIFLEGEYYGWLAEQIPDFDYEVDGVAGYYPRNDELIVSPYPDTGRRREIKRAVLAMNQEPKIKNFGTEQSGLCHWNNSNGEGQCYFHKVCPVRHNCKHCGTEGSDSRTSGSGRYDSQ